MTQEEKDLLMKDLCARLPYGVICGDGYGNDFELNGIDKQNCITFKSTTKNFWTTNLDEYKPYLFPLTEEILDKATEASNTLYKELICSDSDLYKENNKSNILLLHAQLRSSVIKYFHINHIDYNGLIGKGLAIDATDLNIY